MSYTQRNESVSRLTITPITQRKAKEYIQKYHRHHKPPVGSVFQIGVSKDDKLVGVAMVGRPVARMLDNGLTLEVNRVCTTGVKNACSKLYGSCVRIAKELGYRKIVTYILNTETGVSLRASGWTKSIESKGGSWNRNSRGRVDKHPTQPKVRYEKSW